MFRIKSRVVCSERAFIEKQLCLIGSTRLQFRTSVSLGDPLKGQMPGQDRTGPQQTRLYQFSMEFLIVSIKKKKKKKRKGGGSPSFDMLKRNNINLNMQKN